MDGKIVSSFEDIGWLFFLFSQSFTQGGGGGGEMIRGIVMCFAVGRMIDTGLRAKIFEIFNGDEIKRSRLDSFFRKYSSILDHLSQSDHLIK